MSATDNQVMRTTIRLDEEVRRRVQAFAREHQKTFTEVVTQALMDFVNKGAPKKPKKRFVLPTSETKGSRPITDAEYRKAIERMYEEEAERVFKDGIRQ